MDIRHLDMKIEIDSEHGEWVRHPPNVGENYRSTFRVTVIVWVVGRDPQGQTTRVPIMTPASITVPIPRQVYRRRRIPQPSTSSSSGSAARYINPRNPTVDILECNPSRPTYVPSGRLAGRRTARKSTPPRGSWATPPIDPMEVTGAGGEVNGEEDEEKSDPSEESNPLRMPSNATNFSNWLP